MRMPRNAFTLIELLIVVAIIAILAAIAVPNFLEAQVRAKVSRAKTDMRSIATAIESYTVDYNHPPPSGFTSGGGWYKPIDSNGWIISWIDRLVPVTTPIAYITSVPVDPFAINGPVGVGALPPFHKTDWEVYQYCEDYWIPAAARNGLSPNGQGYVTYGSPQIDVCWRLVSMGPDRLPNFLDTALAGISPWNLRDALEYDPTNGTVSHGDVIRYGGSDQGNRNL